MDSADKCRETMENQLSDLRKQCASMEHEIVSAKEDNKTLQQQLRDKVRSSLPLFRVLGDAFLVLQESELLSLAKSVGVEKTALSNVSQQLEKARQLAEQRQAQLGAMQGTLVST